MMDDTIKAFVKLPLSLEESESPTPTVDTQTDSIPTDEKLSLSQCADGDHVCMFNCNSDDMLFAIDNDENFAAGIKMGRFGSLQDVMLDCGSDG